MARVLFGRFRVLEKGESAMSRDVRFRGFNRSAVRARKFLEPSAPAPRLTGSKYPQPLGGAAMIRTPITTTEDIDNATFFASCRLADLLRGETGFECWDDELSDLHIDAAVDAIDMS
jgi:hypothetical protein